MLNIFYLADLIDDEEEASGAFDLTEAALDDDEGLEPEEVVAELGDEYTSPQQQQRRVSNRAKPRGSVTNLPSVDVAPGEVEMDSEPPGSPSSNSLGGTPQPAPLRIKISKKKKKRAKRPGVSFFFYVLVIYALLLFKIVLLVT